MHVISSLGSLPSSKDLLVHDIYTAFCDTCLNTQDIRKAYREQFYTAGIGCSISGAILFKETLYQNSSQEIPFVDCLTRQAVLPGIKVDQASF